MKKNKNKKIIKHLSLFANIILSGAILFGLIYIPESWAYKITKGAKFTIHFFAVGQGDASLVQCGRTQALIDGGPDRTVVEKLGRAMPFTDRKIEYVFLTHPHDDHYFGLYEVFDRYEVGRLFVSAYTQADYRGAELIEYAEKNDISVTIIKTGDVINLENCAEFEVLWPDTRSQSIAKGGPDYENDLSVVLELRTQKNDPLVLYTGDIGTTVESFLLSQQKIKKFSILKIPHHGSRYSSSMNFIRAIRPQYAVASVGINKFGHPSETVLYRLKSAGIKIFRTDIVGDVVVSVSPAGQVSVYQD